MRLAVFLALLGGCAAGEVELVVIPQGGYLPPGAINFPEVIYVGGQLLAWREGGYRKINEDVSQYVYGLWESGLSGTQGPGEFGPVDLPALKVFMRKGDQVREATLLPGASPPGSELLAAIMRAAREGEAGEEVVPDSLLVWVFPVERPPENMERVPWALEVEPGALVDTLVLPGREVWDFVKGRFPCSTRAPKALAVWQGRGFWLYAVPYIKFLKGRF